VNETPNEPKSIGDSWTNLLSAATRAGDDNSKSLMRAAEIGRALPPSESQWDTMRAQQQEELERMTAPKVLTPAEQVEADERRAYARRWTSAAGYPRGKASAPGLPEVADDAP
jgi:hypothetical protein